MMDRNKWMERIASARAYAQRNAYGLTLGICLAVIVGTAVYVRWPKQAPETPPEENVIVGAQDENVQRLEQVQGDADMYNAAEHETIQPAITPSIQPTTAPLSMAYALSQPACVWPLEGNVTREHSADTLVYMVTTDSYELHQGIDIAGEQGAAVVSPLSGTVAALVSDALWGNGIEITHPDGLRSLIYGVKVNTALKEGLAVRAGEQIGTVDSLIAYEEEDGTHIHWTLLRDGEAIDPRQMVQ